MKIYNVQALVLLSLLLGWSITAPAEITESSLSERVSAVIARRCSMSVEEFAYFTNDIREEILFAELPSQDKLGLNLLLVKARLFGENDCSTPMQVLVNNSADTFAVRGMYSSYSKLLEVNSDDEFSLLRKQYTEVMIAYAEKLGRKVIPNYTHRPSYMNIMPQKVVNGRVVYLPGPSGVSPDAYTGKDREGYIAALKRNAENGRINYEQSELRDKLNRMIPGIRMWLASVYNDRVENDQESDAFLARLNAVTTN